jgi:superfamily II DNA or RNA helicase
VFFASAYKSKIKVLQALGRGLRKYKNKVLKLFDIVDNVSLAKTPAIDSKRYVCHAMRHYAKRKKLYLAEGFKYKEVKIKLKPQG